jgi:hypothetical protein
MTAVHGLMLPGERFERKSKLVALSIEHYFVSADVRFGS